MRFFSENKIEILYAVFILLFSASLFANPFAKQNRKGEQNSGSSSEVKVSKGEGFFSNVKKQFISAQRGLNTYLSKVMEKVIKGLGFINLLIISVISLAYGALHSLGPGHGKAIVASYFLKRPDAGKKDVLKVILISSLGHNLSALAIGSLMAIVAGFGNQQNQSLIRSYALLATGIIAIIFGVYLVAKKIVKGNAYSSCGQRANERNDENKEKKYGLLTVGIISGIVPCPLSVAVVFFGFYIKSYIAVFLSVLFMSAGMAFTQGLFGFASLKASSYAAKKANTNKKIYTLLHSFFEYAGACAILIIGLLTVGAFFIS